MMKNNKSILPIYDFYNCNKCNVWLTPEYESKEECLCCNCVVYSDDDESSE